MLDDKNFKLIEQDIVETLELSVDQIYNLACPASPVSYQMEPVKTIETCFIGATNVLKLARKLNIRFFKHQRLRFMAILWFIHSMRIITGM